MLQTRKNSYAVAMFTDIIMEGLWAIFSQLHRVYFRTLSKRVSGKGAAIQAQQVQKRAHLLCFHPVPLTQNQQIATSGPFCQICSHIPIVLFAYRTAIHEFTLFTPYHLTFDHSPMLPVDIMLGRLPSVLVEEGEALPLSQFEEETHPYFKKAYSTVHSNLKQAHERCKQAFDKKEHREIFSVGDQVWLYNPAVKEGCSKKLATQWHGPYTVMDKISPVNYRVQLIGTAHQTVVHRNCLKPAFGIPGAASQSSKPAQKTAAQTSSSPISGRLSYAEVVKRQYQS